MELVLGTQIAHRPASSFAHLPWSHHKAYDESLENCLTGMEEIETYEDIIERITFMNSDRRDLRSTSRSTPSQNKAASDIIFEKIAIQYVFVFANLIERPSVFCLCLCTEIYN